MTMFGANSYEVEKIGRSVQVPDNDIAKCMYYLACVCKTIDYNEGQIRRYTDFSNYWRLSNAECETVYKLCLTLSPDEFEERTFFENDALCGNFDNEMYEISEVQDRLFVVRSIMVAGRARQVQKIMTYKRQWMITNYFRPMNRLAHRFSPEQQLIRAMEEADCRVS